MAVKSKAKQRQGVAGRSIKRQGKSAAVNGIEKAKQSREVNG